MDYQTLNFIGIILLCVSGFFFIISVLLFIRFKIIGIIGDLTGITARKQIERIRSENEKAGVNKGYRPSPLNKSRGKLTESVREGHEKGRRSGKLGKTGQTAGKTDGITGDPFKTPITAEIKTKDIPTVSLQRRNIGAGATDVLQADTELLNNGTEVLIEGTELLNEGTAVLTAGTEVLNNNGTAVLSGGTEVLTTGETAVLGTDEIKKQQNKFVVKKSVVLIHTAEVI
jgi:hypothetical protein